MDKEGALNSNTCTGGRILCLDYARIIVAVLVIYGHITTRASVENVYIYAFHMPFFFLVSGMLHKYDGTIQWKKYTRSLLVPLLFFNILVWLIMVPLTYYCVKNGIVNYESKMGINYNNTLSVAFYDSFVKYLLLNCIMELHGSCLFCFIVNAWWMSFVAIDAESYLCYFYISFFLFIFSWGIR